MPTYEKLQQEWSILRQRNQLFNQHTPEFIMSGKQILAIVLAIVAAIVLFNVVSWIFGAIWSLLSWAIYAILVGGAIYLLYKFIFNKMLSSGKRLT